jgi:indolepyruvate ferredoxin oxidoreductase, beta subunit
MLEGVICGKGGQGVISINQLLGRLATALGYGVISAETHGMAMRGGSVATLIKIGDFRSPSIGLGGADFILATDMDEARRNFAYLSEGGCCIVNSTVSYPFPEGYSIIQTDASGLSLESTGSTRNTGLVLLGEIAGVFDGVFPAERSIDILKNFENLNTDAVRAGMAAVNSRR